MGDVYLRLFVADPSVAEIEHPDRFARALLKSLGGLSVIVGQAGDEEAEGETIAASGRQGDTAPAVDGIDGGKQQPHGSPGVHHLGPQPLLNCIAPPSYG